MDNVLNVLAQLWGGIDQYVNAVLVILGGFRLLALVTPTDKDDKFWAKAISFVGGYKKK